MMPGPEHGAPSAHGGHAITLTCDKCDQAFTVHNPVAGTKVTCPFCGDTNVVRLPGTSQSPPAAGSPNTPPGSDRAAALGLPPALGPEQTVMVVPGAMFRNRPITAALVILLLLGSGIAAGWLGAQGKNTWAYVSLGVCVVCVFILIGWKFVSWSERLTITTKRVILTRGIFSKRTVEALHRTIQEIEISQTFWQRILGVGRMEIANASEGGQVIVVSDAPDPYRLRRTIDAYRPM